MHISILLMEQIVELFIMILMGFIIVKAGIVKEVDVYIAPKIFGGSAGYTPVGGMGVESPEEAYPFELGSVQRFGADIMLQYFQITA